MIKYYYLDSQDKIVSFEREHIDLHGPEYVFLGIGDEDKDQSIKKLYNLVCIFPRTEHNERILNAFRSDYPELIL